MGTKARQRPKRLGEKLLQIRQSFGLSQNEMIMRLEVEVTQNTLSSYELGNREPPLLILLSYARAAGVSMEVLADDELELPARIKDKVRRGGR
jgi:transcriptional regulator with XRE-family HTH domain